MTDEEDGLTEERWRGTSFPSEKSLSAGSMATGSSRRNSKSAGSSGRGSSAGVSAGEEEEEDDDDDDFFLLMSFGDCSVSFSLGSSRLKEIRGLSQP